MNTPKHITAFAPNWLGDVAMATPALRALHNRFPSAELSVAGRETSCELLRGLSWISGLYPIPHRAGPARTFWATRALRRKGVDLAVVFPHSLRSAVAARLNPASRCR